MLAELRLLPRHLVLVGNVNGHSINNLILQVNRFNLVACFLREIVVSSMLAAHGALVLADVFCFRVIWFATGTDHM